MTLKNCTFEKVIASPFGDQQNRPGDANRSLTVTDCTFSNVYNAYALKDIYPANAVIKDNHFENCSGAIYFEGTIPRGTIAISENQFGNIDQYAAAGKENTRGIIQLSAGFTTATSTQIILKDNTITGNLVKDENVTGGLAVLRQIANLDWQGDRRLDTRQGVFDQGGGSIHIALHAGWDGWKNQLPICWLGRNGRLSGCDGYHQRISFSSRRSRDAKWDVLCCVGANKLYRHLQRRRRRRSLCRSSIYCCARRCHT